jgi:hypothetical protein
MNMSDLVQASTPHTPPSRPSRHRVDSFPTDDIHEDSGFDEDDALSDSALGMPTSVSMGAFPVFLIQDSPTRCGVSKAGKHRFLYAIDASSMIVNTSSAISREPRVSLRISTCSKSVQPSES